MPPTDTFASQSFARLTLALEQALVKGALKGDRSAMEDLRRELTALRLEAATPPPPPAPFRGKRQLVFEALLSGCSQREAARKSGCTEQTVHRWVKKDPVFMGELDKARAERMQSAKDGITDLVPSAVRRLRGVLLDPSAQHRDVITAAREVLDRAGIVARKGLELSGPGGAPVTVDVTALAAMTPDQLRALAMVHAAPEEVDSTADLPAEDADP